MKLSHLLVLDTETSGLSPARHDVIQIGAILLDACTLEELASFESLVRPERFRPHDPSTFSERSLGVTGRDWSDLVRLQRSAPRMREVLLEMERKFAGVMGPAPRMAPLVFGQNVLFDLRFIHAATQRLGMGEARYGERFEDLMRVCTFVHKTLGFQTEGGKRGLDAQAAAFGLERGKHHDALEDVRLTAELLRRYVRMLEAEGLSLDWLPVQVRPSPS